MLRFFWISIYVSLSLSLSHLPVESNDAMNPPVAFVLALALALALAFLRLRLQLRPQVLQRLYIIANGFDHALPSINID